MEEREREREREREKERDCVMERERTIETNRTMVMYKTDRSIDWVKIERDRSIDRKRRIGRFIMYRILKYRKRWKHRMIELIVRDQTIDS